MNAGAKILADRREAVERIAHLEECLARTQAELASSDEHGSAALDLLGHTGRQLRDAERVIVQASAVVSMPFGAATFPALAHAVAAYLADHGEIEATH